MKMYQYKIYKSHPRNLFYKFETEQPYTFTEGDRVWFPDNWKKELGGGDTWKVVRVEHYPVEKLIAVIVRKD